MEWQETLNMNHTLIYSSFRFIASRMNNSAAEATKQTLKLLTPTQVIS